MASVGTSSSMEKLQTSPEWDRIRADSYATSDAAAAQAQGDLTTAYNDAAGVTAEFNRNVLAVLNREVGAAFDLDTFEHVAFWNAEQSWMEMRLRSTRRQCVHIAALGMDVPFEAGEEIRTEISAKFTRPGVEDELVAAGLRPAAWWTDDAGDFALSLSVPVGAAAVVDGVPGPAS